MSISTPRIHFEAIEGGEAERKQTSLKGLSSIQRDAERKKLPLKGLFSRR
jgi:hypothetical protein